MTTPLLGPLRPSESDAVFRPTRRDVDPETGAPDVSALSDRHDWHPGVCWLWCEPAETEVTWLGPVQSSGMHADLFACRACLYRLDQLVLTANLRKDSPGNQTPAPVGRLFTAPTGAGRHRKALSIS
ncbi:hypothetical protein ACFV97_34420 [Streptomyces sp. NPDC059913]|uniref:hypothetical protein n=1 Tax=unclassified Streptomyces TaxID=2593676 RepID=UPI003654F4D1